METAKYILNLIKSKNAKPLYRTKLMVVGDANVGKTTLIDSLFNLSSVIEKKRRMLPGYNQHQISLLGKRLIEYTDSKEKKEYSINDKCKVELQSNDHIFLTIDEKDKEILLKFPSEKERNIWYQRLKRAVRNEATHGIDVSRQEVTHPIVIQTFKEIEQHPKQRKKWN